MTEIITASAGTGKTYRLTELLHESAVSPDRIMATTFTVKAAHELMGRARSRLLEAGRSDDAQLLPASLIGTVHAIGGRLLESFAYELGLSPSMDVIPETDTSVFLQEALEKVLTEQPWQDQVEDAADAFNIEEQAWQAWVRALLDAARNNRIAPADLEACGDECTEELLAFLDPPQEGDWDGQLLAALEYMVDRLPDHVTNREREAHQVLTDARDALKQRRLKWSQWPKLIKLEVGKTWKPAMEPVRAAAAAYLWHPCLRQHISEYVRGVFHFAAQGLEAYRNYKAEYRLIDYGDQEERLLHLLETEEPRARIAERVQLLLVDEFQDTSPMQLANFLKLAELAPRSIWVGDPKQAIYNFRGTDPQLMHECLKQLEHGQSLDTSYRSRPDLVRLVSTVFRAPFAAQNIAMADMRAARQERPGMPPAFGLWALQTQNKTQDWEAVARGVQRLLERPNDTLIEDPVSKALRPLHPGDIAVLCRQRESCRALADALSAAGLEVALKQPGVMDTPEGLLAAAGLRLMLDPSDTLAAGTIAFFDRSPQTSADAWLEARIRDVAAGTGPWEAFASHPRVAAVRNARPALQNASPTEALEAAMEALDLHLLCLALPQASQGLANLEALRSLAAQYEERCRVLRLPATAAGLLAELHRLHKERQDEGADGIGGAAVRVLTYHGAKGLEWPVVVLAELDYEGPASWSGVQVESRGTFSLDNPLANRFVRFWFSPFDLQLKVEYLERLAASETAQALERRAAEERLRLLYVGATRARDHVVVAVRVGKNAYQQSWLELVPDLVLPPVGPEEACVVAGIRARAWLLTPGLAEPRPREEPRWFALPEGSVVERRPARVIASGLHSAAGATYGVGKIVQFGVRLKTGPIEERDTLGTAVHAFLAADPGASSPAAEREGLAGRLLSAYGQSGTLQPAQLLEVRDRLQGFLAERYPGAKQYREWPLAGWQDGQEMWGQADLVLDTVAGWVVIDYKTFEGRPEEAAKRFGGQLAAYGKAIEGATGRCCRAACVYLVFQSVIVEAILNSPEVNK